jgi:hypothetical protein
MGEKLAEFLVEFVISGDIFQVLDIIEDRETRLMVVVGFLSMSLVCAFLANLFFSPF